jgi:hypothetical protein
MACSRISTASAVCRCAGMPALSKSPSNRSTVGVSKVMRVQLAYGAPARDQVVVLHSELSVGDALKTLADANVLSAPMVLRLPDGRFSVSRIHAELQCPSTPHVMFT